MSLYWPFPQFISVCLEKNVVEKGNRLPTYITAFHCTCYSWHIFLKGLNWMHLWVLVLITVCYHIAIKAFPMLMNILLTFPLAFISTELAACLVACFEDILLVCQACGSLVEAGTLLTRRFSGKRMIEFIHKFVTLSFVYTRLKNLVNLGCQCNVVDVILS